jgi:hypothetical protein
MVYRLERRVGYLSSWRCKHYFGWSLEYVVHIHNVYNGYLIPPKQWRVLFSSPNAGVSSSGNPIREHKRIPWQFR